MSPLFGKRRAAGKTVAVLDIESGSVGSALVRVAPGRKPHLFAQRRTMLPVRASNSASAILREIEKASNESLHHTSEVASRMRGHEAMGDIGHIDHVSVFLHAPWVTIDLSSDTKKPSTDASDEMLNSFRESAEEMFDSVPVTFHAFATSASPVIHGLFGQPENAIICTITGELAELSVLRGGMLAGHATVPTGLNTLLRTLRSHAGLSQDEALSALSLIRQSQRHEWTEPLLAGVRHFGTQLADALPSIITPTEAEQVFVVAPHPTSEWFARMLTEDDSLHSVFAPGSTTRAVLAQHMTPHMGAHPRLPDVPLVLESLFVDTRFGKQ